MADGDSPVLERAAPSKPISARRNVPMGLAAGAVAALLGVLVAVASTADAAPGAAGAALAFLAITAGLVLVIVRRLSGPSALDLAFMGVDGTPAAPPHAAAIEALPDPLLVISALEPDDLTGRRYVLANAAARLLLRIERSEGLLVTAVRDPEVLEAADEALFGALEAERLYEIAGVQPKTLRVMARPLGMATDGARLALLLFRDETESRRIERTRTDFLANASHELRTPLASLAGFIETLRGHARDDEGARDRFLSIMQTQAERMGRLIEDLMSLSRIELNEYVVPDDVVDLRLAVMDVADAIGPLAKERGVTLRLDLPPAGAARVRGDRDQIIQVIQNLVDNALKYSPRNGTVGVSVAVGQGAETAAAGQRASAARLALLTPDHSAEAYAVLRVSDQGVGIAREHLPRLTERFYRVEGQKSGDHAGTGLGLAIVKHIANRHRGGLAVESAVGEGTTFVVYLPMLPAEDPAATEPAAIKLS